MMQTFFTCLCGNGLGYEDSLCPRCQRAVGWCPGCQSISPVEEIGETLVCRREGCHLRVMECHNRRVENVCNRFISLSEDPDESTLCDYCATTRIVPDLSIEGNRDRWYRMEVAKRRLLRLLDGIGLNYSGDIDRHLPPLAFEFRTDTLAQGESWRDLAHGQRVTTGHADGVITVTECESDSRGPEKPKRAFQESRRTLIGHLRHEAGHYYWMALVADQCEEPFAQIFGDHRTMAYDASMERYFADGLKTNWESSYISPYAAAHPWEDFAETFALYLDIRAALDMAPQLLSGFKMPSEPAATGEWVSEYLRICDVSNELSRGLGIEDSLPRAIAPAVVAKLEFLDRLVRAA